MERRRRNYLFVGNVLQSKSSQWLWPEEVGGHRTEVVATVHACGFWLIHLFGMIRGGGGGEVNRL